MADGTAQREGPHQQRVALVHWSFPPTTGGVESHVLDLAHALAAAGWRVTVITGEPAPDTSPDFEVVTTQLLNLDWVRARESDQEAYTAALRLFLGGMLAQRRYQIVHGHNLHHFAPAPALVLDELRMHLGFRLFHTFHETWPDLLRDTPVYRMWDGNFAVSQFVQAQCRARLDFEPQLLHLGVDPARFDLARGGAASLPTGDPVILHPARLLPWKGVESSVRMIHALSASGIPARLLLTDTPRIVDWHHDRDAYRRQIGQLIADLGVERRVELRTVPYAEMPALYHAATLVVYPTIADEPFGLVPLEAMSCGKPLVATRCGGIPETVVHDETGYLIDPGDDAQFAHAVMSLLRDPERAHQMGLAGRQRVLERFTLAGYVRTLLGRYGAALAR